MDKFLRIVACPRNRGDTNRASGMPTENTSWFLFRISLAERRQLSFLMNAFFIFAIGPRNAAARKTVSLTEEKVEQQNCWTSHALQSDVWY